MGTEHGVSTRHLHVIGGITSSYTNVVATQLISNLSNVGSENHPIKKVAITIDMSRSHTYTSCSCKQKVHTDMKFAVKEK